MRWFFPVFLGLFYSPVVAWGHSCLTVWVRCLWGQQSSVPSVTHGHSLCAGVLVHSTPQSCGKRLATQVEFFLFKWPQSLLSLSDCSHSLSTSVKAQRSPPLRVNRLEERSTCKGGHSNHKRRELGLSEAVTSSGWDAGLLHLCLRFKALGTSASWAKGTHHAFDFLLTRFVMVFHLTFNRLVKSQVIKPLGTRGFSF